MTLFFKKIKISKKLLFLKENILVAPFLLLFLLPFLIVISLLTNYLNREIVFKNKAVEADLGILSSDSIPWKIYKTSENLSDPEFKIETNKDQLLGIDSGVFINNAEKGVGIVKKLPEKLEGPLTFKAKLLVVSGRVHISLIDDKEREFYAGEIKAENKWQDLSAEIITKFSAEEFNLTEIRIYALDKNTSWYTNNANLTNFNIQQRQISSTETFAPVPPPYNLRVMLIALNPVESGENLVDHFQLGWEMSAVGVEDTFASNIISDFQQLSNNKINYQVVKKLNISSFPQYLNGFTYDFAKYSQCLAGDPGRVCERQKSYFDHIRWVRENQICEIADRERIDAIWLIDPAYLTTWENFLIGPREGFNVSGGFYIIPECQKHYLVNTGNYSGDQNNLHISHSFGHAIEVIMEYYITPRWSLNDKNRFWENFTMFDFLSKRPVGVDFDILPQTFCGNIHWPSNGRRHYDYNNLTNKDFSCPDWKNFPSSRDDKENINCELWGCSWDSGWETYWLSTLPDSWWSFLLLPDETIRYRRAGAPIPYSFSNCQGQYFGFDQCDARADKSKQGVCQLNPALGTINPSNPSDPINTWKWSYCLFGGSIAPTSTLAPTVIPTQTPTVTPRPTSTLTPSPTPTVFPRATPTLTPGPSRLNCQGQYFGKSQCDARASVSYGKGGTCQLNPALGTINPSNPSDPINTWKWSYCK